MLPGNATDRPSRARGQPGRPPVPLSRFIGRERELDAVLAALSDARTVCLTGPGGAGKTRLAIAAAERAAGRFADGVRWVDLAQVAQHASIVRALAIPLGVREVSGRALFDSIVAELAERECLLVLDNCEHVLNACRHVVRHLLAECPRLHVLVTSREVLAVSGEIDFPVPPLDERESSRLFCARAAAVVPGFDPDAAGVDAIARICRHLDGLPLALELAAARVRVLSVAEIADALEDRLAEFVASDPSTLDRHRTLRATLDWSFRLLTGAERRLLLELSVFRGGFTLDTARAVHTGDGDEPGVLELVSRLVDRSLVTATRQPMGGTRTRYALLETVRLYAAGLLDQSGDAPHTRSRHAEFFVAFAESVEPELSGVGQREWLDLIELERGNLGAALRWSAQGGGSRVDGLRLTAALWRFCYLRGYYTEGRRWSDQTLAAAPDAPPALRARALTAAGSLAFLQCAYPAATHRLDEALRLYRELGDEHGIAGVLQTLGSVARERGEYPTSRRLHEDSLVRWRALDDSDGSARSLNYLSLLAWLQGDLGRAGELAGEAADLFRALGDGEGVAWSLLNLGAAALYDARHDQAQALLAESLSRSITVGYREGVAWSRDLLGVLAAARGDRAEAAASLRESLRVHWALGDRWRTSSVLEALAGVTADASGAARLLGAGAALRAEIGTPRPPVEADAVARTRARLVGVLGADSVTTAETLGRVADVAQVVRDVLGAATVPQPAPPTPSPESGRSLSVTALGNVTIRLGERDLPAAEFGYAKPRELLCFLLDRGEATKEQVGLALWPAASTAQLRSSFHTTLHHLRAALGCADWIEFASGRYRVSRALPHRYDVAEYEALLGRAREAEDAERPLAAAVRLYRGEFLGDLPGEEWIEERRTQLRRSCERALLTLGRLYRAAGRYAEAIEVLHRALAQDPLRESVHRELMRCYAASGERGRAVRHYRDLADLLRSELGVPPAPETAQLEARIRGGGTA